ncbi:MAG: GPP34 family phosphoprotein [Bacteroidales bacterium]|nr:GPP34 family phosphoprotein [Bacteroidales bacterium]
MRNLKLPHRIVAMDHADPEKERVVPGERMQNIVTFSALVEAIMMGKLDLIDSNLLLRDDTPTSHAMIDQMLQILSRSPVNKDLIEWVNDLGVQVPLYKHVRENLVENNILHLQKKKLMGIAMSSKYTLKDPRIVTNYIQYLDVLNIEEQMDIRDLLCMIFLRNTDLNEISFLSKDPVKVLSKLNADNRVEIITDIAYKL